MKFVEISGTLKNLDMYEEIRVNPHHSPTRLEAFCPSTSRWEFLFQGPKDRVQEVYENLKRVLGTHKVDHELSEG